MSEEKRRDDNSRRVKVKRRQNGFSMISNYANYSGIERRINSDRRTTPDRRAVVV